MLGLRLFFVFVLVSTPMTMAETIDGYNPRERYHIHNGPMVESPEQVKLAWEGPEHIGVGKGSSSSPVRKSDVIDRDDSFYRGVTSPLVVNGMVIVSYFKPAGPIAKLEQDLPDSYKRISADDIVIALDKETGKVIWKQVFPGKGINVGGGKRFHWATSPAYGDGKVFVTNPLGALYALDAATGKVLWETPPDTDLLAEKEACIKEGKQFRKNSYEQRSLVYAGGNVIFPNLQAVSAVDGQQKWSIDGKTMLKEQGLRPNVLATSAVWSKDGKEYLLVNCTDTMLLLDAENGKQIWKYAIGSWGQSPAVNGDLVICNIRNSKLEGMGVLGALKLTLEGPKPLWELPEEYPFLELGAGGDRGHDRTITYGKSVAIISLWGRKADQNGGGRKPSLIIVRLSDGKITQHLVDEQPRDKNAGEMSAFVSDSLFVNIVDPAHGAPKAVNLYRVDQEAGTMKLLGPMRIGSELICGYEVLIEPRSVDGRIYFRSMQGIACFDFRKGTK